MLMTKQIIVWGFTFLKRQKEILKTQTTCLIDVTFGHIRYRQLCHSLFPIELFLSKVRKRAKIRNRYNQTSHLTQDTNGKVTTSQLNITNKSQDMPYILKVNKEIINFGPDLYISSATTFFLPKQINLNVDLELMCGSCC